MGVIQFTPKLLVLSSYNREYPKKNGWGKDYLRVPSARARLSFAQTKLRRVNRRESAPLVLLVRAEALCPSPIFAKTDVGHRMSYIYQRFAGVCPAYIREAKELNSSEAF